MAIMPRAASSPHLRSAHDHGLVSARARRGPGSDQAQHLSRPHRARAYQLVYRCGTCPSLNSKRVTPYVLRHSAAMELRRNGVDRTVIALWLGHESVETTQMYVHADIEIKERAMERTRPMSAPTGRYRPNDQLFAFLEAL